MKGTGLGKLLWVSGCLSATLWGEPNFEEGASHPRWLPFGEGAGEYASEGTTARMRAWKKWFLKTLASKRVEREFGEDSVRHLRHYFLNSGKALDIPVEKLLRESASARAHLEAQKRGAVEFLKGSPPGRYEIGNKRASGVHIKKKESLNWYNAIASYQGWFGAEVEVFSGKDGVPVFKGEAVYHVYDIYDWDPGGKIFIKPGEFPFLTVTITNGFMGQFHREGLGREYPAHGVAAFSWEGRFEVDLDG